VHQLNSGAYVTSIRTVLYRTCMLCNCISKHVTYKASTPAPDKQHQRRNKVDQEQRSGRQQDEMVVHTEREIPRSITVTASQITDWPIYNLCVTGFTQTTVISCFHLSRISTTSSFIIDVYLFVGLLVYKKLRTVSGAGA